MPRPVVPLLTNWRKSTRSGAQGQCVDVGAGFGVRGVRDSKLGATGPVLRFDESAFVAFLDGVKRGKLDR